MPDGYSFIKRWRTKVLKFPSLFSSAYALFHFPYTTFFPSSALLSIHSALFAKNTGVCTNSSHIGTSNPLLATLTSILQALPPFVSHSCALFCTPRNVNAFVFKHSRTLC